ncbi:MAG: DUF2927 domain-containing protein [Rhodospirillaceae bacterium]|nr:DUF2927 domain-containing protein [Rhodospirillaceae bacterium]
MRPISPYFLAAFLLAALPAISAGAADPDQRAEEERPSVEQLVRLFDTVVFGSEFRAVSAVSAIRKWKTPLRVIVREYGEIVTRLAGGRVSRRMEQQSLSEKYLTYVQRHLSTLADLTGLKTQDVTKTRWPANFIINFVPPLQMANPDLADVPRGILQRLAAQGGCYFLAWPDDTGKTLLKAVIVVNKARTAAKTNHCVLEEMTQSLGLPNDANPSWPSIFSNTGTVSRLSWSDRVLIQALYDPRMTPGMARKSALETARRIFTEHLAK